MKVRSKYYKVFKRLRRFAPTRGTNSGLVSEQNTVFLNVFLRADSNDTAQVGIGASSVEFLSAALLRNGDMLPFKPFHCPSRVPNGDFESGILQAETRAFERFIGLGGNTVVWSKTRRGCQL